MAITAKTKTRLLEHFGSEQAMLDAARRYDIEAFRDAAGGAGERRAAQMISELLGLHREGFLATERAGEILEGIIGLLQGYARTSYARNRLRLTGPLEDRDRAAASIRACMAARERLEGLPRRRMEELLSGLSRPVSPSPKFDSSTVLLVESGDEFDNISAGPLSRHLRVLSAEDPSGLEDAEVVVYVSSMGRLDITRLENVVTVPTGARDYEMVPQVVLDHFTANRELWARVAEIRSILGQKSVCTAIGAALEKVRGRQLDFRTVEKAVLQVRDELNAELRAHASELQLSGDEVLEVLGQGVPRKVRDIFTRALAAGRARMREISGHDIAPFEMKYPVEVDDRELERVRRSIMAQSGTTLFEERVRAARALRDLRERAEDEVREALELDYELALGAFALDFGLTAPCAGKGFRLEGLAHLGLARQKDVQKVDWNIGGGDNAVLLTGANSGGKTTLLEALAQAVIMARCGLPVCARAAELELPDELYYFSQQRNLNAGAFESFLRTLVPAVTGGARKLILADELEAMTELEAGARIVAAIVDRVRQTDSTIVVVTHLAREISKFTKVRIDGIEARGLDADYNLIVDRAPRKGLLARSTPELILRRLAETSAGPEKAIYRDLLDKVQD
jgi:hypothetical protein